MNSQSRMFHSLTNYGLPLGWRRRVGCYALGMLAFTGCFAVATPLVAAAQQPGRVGGVHSFGGIETGSLSEIVSYNRGFATVASDNAGDILLFTEATGATTWTRTEVYNAANDGVGMSSPAIATSGKKFAIVAYEDDTDFLFSWIGSVAHGFTAQIVSDSDNYPSTPSIAYSPLANNYVVTDTDNFGDIDYWYSTTGSGGWQQQTVASPNGTGIEYVQAVVTVTDMGVVIVGSNGVSDFDTFFQPFATSGWAENGEGAGNSSDLSIAWSGSEAYLSLDDSTGLDLFSISDEGSFENGALVYSSTSDLLGDYISWSGSNAVLVSNDGNGNINFFYSNANVTSFTEETVASNTPTVANGAFPAIAVGHSTVEVTDATNKGKLYDWSQPIGATGWTKQLIGK